MNWAQARRILCIRLDGMGDVLMTTPAIRAIREARPEARIILLASSTGAAVAPLVPEIDAAIAYDAPWMKAGADAPLPADLALIERLRAGRFDAAVIFTVHSQSAFPAALLCRLAGIPLVLGRFRERTYGLASDPLAESEPESGELHEVERQLSLVATRGWRPSHDRMSCRLDTRTRNEWAARLAGHGLVGERWLLVHPGATAPSRRYPLALLEQSLQELTATGWGLALAGGPGESATLARLRTALPEAVFLAPNLSLPDVAAIIAAAPVFLCNNSGPAHLAAALGTPVVVTYAATNPQHHPWRTPRVVLTAPVPCAGCRSSLCPRGDQACLTAINPRTVAAAVDALAASTRRGTIYDSNLHQTL